MKPVKEGKKLFFSGLSFVFCFFFFLMDRSFLPEGNVSKRVSHKLTCTPWGHGGVTGGGGMVEQIILKVRMVCDGIIISGRWNLSNVTHHFLWWRSWCNWNLNLKFDKQSLKMHEGKKAVLKLSAPESITTLGCVLNFIFLKQHAPVSHYAKQRRARGGGGRVGGGLWGCEMAWLTWCCAASQQM